MKKITEQEWIVMKANLWTDFLQNASPLEIHQSVMTANWDDCKNLLQFIIDYPKKIDKATALLAYWKTQPDYYKKFENEIDYIEKVGYNLFFYQFINKVEQNFSEGKHINSIIFFDPKNCEFYQEIEREIDDEELELYKGLGEDFFDAISNSKETIKLIPEIMKQSTGNEYVEEPEDFEDGLPLSLAQKLFDLLDEYEVIY